jgi:hypothetical protein
VLYVVSRWEFIGPHSPYEAFDAHIEERPNVLIPQQTIVLLYVCALAGLRDLLREPFFDPM